MHTPPAQPDDEQSPFPRALISLLEKACDDNGVGAPALTAASVEVEPSSSDLYVRLHFANGHEFAHLFSHREVRAFCAERGIRRRAELQEILLDEALPIYERMREASLGEELGDEEDEENVSILEVGTPAARERGFRLLFLHLTPLQRHQLSKKGYFEVIGGDSGHCYRIWRGRVMNVDQLDRKGRRVCSWCFYPEGQIVTGDIMLAQKLALELDEKATLRIAGKERSRSHASRVAFADE